MQCYTYNIKKDWDIRDRGATDNEDLRPCTKRELSKGVGPVASKMSYIVDY